MAAVAYTYQAQPPQGSQGRGQAPQDDPLFAALEKYITTGPDATNITMTELQKLYDENLADPASKMYLEQFLVTQSAASCSSSWADKAVMAGTITLAKTGLSFELVAPSLHVTTTGGCTGLFIPSSTPITGTLHYKSLDNLAPGEGTFSFYVKGLTVYVNFYRNQDWVANFTASPISFTMPPIPKEGTNTWS
ncbi:hypothetical protein MMC26_004683 [Xylographa opegraphella]|nr:hypothetical protein [Xylographa opegraphella]